MKVVQIMPERLLTGEGGFLRRRVRHYAILLTLIMLLIILGLVTSIITAPSVRLKGLGASVLVTFSMNGALALVMLVVEMLRRPYTLALIHWMFYLCFFVVAPVCQYVNGYSCWGYFISDEQMLKVNFLLLVWGGLFAVFSNVSLKRKVGLSRVSGGGTINVNRLHINTKRAAILLLASAISVSLLILIIGIENLFSRGAYELALEQTFNQTVSLVIDKILRATPLFALVFILAGDERHPVIAAMAFGLLLLADFPTGMARYNAAVIYGGLLLLYFSPMRKRGVFPVLFLLAFLVLFPAISTFRINGLSLNKMITAISDSIVNIPTGFCAGDYDAYSMLARSVRYVEQWGTTNGGQLLTAILFFVPRAIWPSKAMGSGWTIAEAQGQDFTNLSCPLPAEGIMNFGVSGLVVFAAVFGVGCRLIDDYYWRVGGQLKSRGLALFYPFLCMFFFFMMRGDLLSSTAYTVGYGAVFLAMYFLLN